MSIRSTVSSSCSESSQYDIIDGKSIIKILIKFFLITGNTYEYLPELYQYATEILLILVLQVSTGIHQIPITPIKSLIIVLVFFWNVTLFTNFYILDSSVVTVVGRSSVSLKDGSRFTVDKLYDDALDSSVLSSPQNDPQTDIDKAMQKRQFRIGVNLFNW